MFPRLFMRLTQHTILSGITATMRRPIALGVLAAMLFALCSLAAYQFYAPARTANLPSTAQEIPAPVPNYRLSDNDQLLCETIFRAQDRGDYRWADALMAQLTDPILRGTMLAQRYMAEDYRASRDALEAWLLAYGDQPQAPRIRRLAERKGSAHDRLAELATVAPLRGDGYIDHLGRRSAPAAFYTGLRAWKQQRYAQAYEAFAAASQAKSTSDWHRAASFYWAARAATQAGDSHAAQTALGAAAQYPITFYGQLANAQLGRHDALLVAAPRVPAALRNVPAVHRATALAQIGQRELAEAELRTLITTLDRAERPAVLTLASEMGLANLQVRLATLDGLSDEESIFARYPMPQWIIGAQSMIDPSLLLAMARQESSFRDEAQSPMGATGMMQMLPSTARHVESLLPENSITLAANDADIPLAAQLDDPVVSARLGAEYVAILTRHPAVRNNLIRLVASYNAGPGAVAGWQRYARTISDPLLYLESIPYPETRNYVMQVLAHQWIYATLLGEPAASRDALLRGQWPMLEARS